MPAKICKATKLDGQPCGTYALAGGEYCFAHDPARAGERAAARKMGGYNRKTAHGASPTDLPAQVRTLEDVYRLLDYTLAETVALDNSIIRSRALIALADTYGKLFTGADLENRITRLEELANEKRRDRETS